VKYEIVWANGTLDGYSNHSPLHLDFNLENGTVEGLRQPQPDRARYDKVSGKLTGGMNHSPVDVTIVNDDLSDFIPELLPGS